jgi:hypothetical protein
MLSDIRMLLHNVVWFQRWVSTKLHCLILKASIVSAFMVGVTKKSEVETTKKIKIKQKTIESFL